MPPDLAALRHLWDGTEPGWSLVRVQRTTWTVTVHFPETGPDLRQIAALRRIVPRLRDRPSNEVLAELRGRPTVVIASDSGSIECRSIVEAARHAGLDADAHAVDRGGLLPNSPEGRTLIIEDAALAELVVSEMLAAGVPVLTVDDH